MNARRDVHVHADVQILELGVDQGIDQTARGSAADSNARLKTPGRNRNAIADAKLGGLAVNDANFRVVDNVRRAVGHQEICLRARQRQAVVRGGQVLQLIECN